MALSTQRAKNQLRSLKTHNHDADFKLNALETHPVVIESMKGPAN